MKKRFFTILGLLLTCLLDQTQAQQLAATTQRVALDLRQVRQQLVAPTGVAARSGPAPTFRISLPTPQGGRAFVLTETFVLPADDPAARQRLRTFIGYEAANPARRVALTLTADALTAQLLQGPEALWLHPAPAGGNSYLLEPAAPAPSGPCGTVDIPEPAPAPGQQRTTNATTLPAPGSFGTQLRTLRAAILVSQEFYDANKGTSNNDQNVEAAVVTIMNGMTAFYRQELSAGFTLVQPTSGPTSGYYFSAMTTATLPNSGANVPGQVRLTNVSDVNSIVQARFAAASYDLGHCLHNTGGGVAYQPAICGTYRGGGWSGASPSGSFQNILAHEIGHQFGAGHAFSGPCGSQETGSNLEPGGGASVMAYTYVCGSQTLIDRGTTDQDHFSLRSLDQMRTRLLTAGCLTSTYAIPPTANTNRPPTVNAGADYVIPTQTPFTLTATATDPDGNALVYTWNQFDYTTNANALGTIAGTEGLAAIDDPNAPLFRPRPPRTANSRTFPDLRYILANSNQPADRVGEALSRVGRDIHFGVTVRDQVASGGAWASDNVTVTVAPNTGPFALTTQNTAGLWIAGQSATVTWSVNGTDQAPISVSNVRITLSTDGGQTFPTVLAASTPNDGSQAVTIPNVTTAQARLRVEAVGNIFFDINDVDFPIGPCAQVASQILPATAVTAVAGAAALNLLQNGYSLTELTGANRIAGTITTADPASNLTFYRNNACQSYSNVTYFDTYSFVPSTTDTYDVTTPTRFSNMVTRLYAGSFDPANPCQNLLADGYNATNTASAALTAGQRYTLVVSSFNATVPATATYAINFASAMAGGTAYAPLQSAGYEYQYAVVNTATNTVVQLAPTADLRTLPPGTYDVYGALFQRGYDVSGLVNRSLSNLQAALSATAPCGQLSTNTRRVTITGTPLPVVLTRLTGHAAGPVNELQWSTASEAGVAYFEVERSLDGATFTALGRVPATNTHAARAYTLTDTVPSAGLAYYRLRVQDQSGPATYSPVATVQRAGAAAAAFSVQAYPNPVPTGGTLQLQLQTPEAQTVQLALTDMVGRTVWRQAVVLPAGTTLLAVPATSHWQGVYVLTVQPAAGPAQQQKVLF
jgi:hypothetical protein